MRTSFLACALIAAGTAAAAAAVADCPSGSCSVRERLTDLAGSPPSNYGEYYENSRAGIDRAPEAAGRWGAPRTSGLTAARPAPRPSLSMPEPKGKKDDRGFLGFLGKHKWSIGGAVAGGLLTLLIGGGIFGLLAGIALSVGVAYLGPKTFSKHTDED